MRNRKNKKAVCFFFSFRQCQAQSSVTSLHNVATAKGCNLFGLESRSSKWSADNSPEVSFKRVPLFNYFLGDLWRQCDNETVSFTCGSRPTATWRAIPNSFIYWVISIHFDAANSFDRVLRRCRGQGSFLTFLLNAIEVNGSDTDRVVSFPANVAKKTQNVAWRFRRRRSDSYYCWTVAFCMNPKSLFDCFAGPGLYVRCSVMDNTQGRLVPLQQRRSHYHRPNAIHLYKRVCLRIGRILPDVGQHTCTGP